MELKKCAGGKFEFNLDGLKLEINPVQLFKDQLGRRGQSTLDLLLENHLKKLLNNFINSNQNTPEYRKALYEKTTYASEYIMNIACFERDLLWHLHSDSEVINLTEKQQEVRDFCFSVCKFCIEYGFRHDKKIEI